MIKSLFGKVGVFVLCVFITLWSFLMLFMNSSPMSGNDMLPPETSWGFPFLFLNVHGYEPIREWHFANLALNMLALIIPLGFGIWLAKKAFFSK